VTIACGLACNRRESPQAAYQHAYKTFVHGDLKQSQDEARLECARFRDSNPELAWQFRILEAESSLWQGMYQQALATLTSQPTQPRNNDSLIEVLAIEGAALGRLHQFPEAEQRLGQALHICQDSPQDTCGDVTRARGVVATQQGQLDAAKLFFEQSLQFADSHHDSFLRETALLNLGLTSLRERHFDESIDWTDAAYRESTLSGADLVTQGALGNLGWAYFFLGDTEKSLELSLEAAKRAGHAGNVTGQLTWVTAAGYVYASRGDIAGATQSYMEALDLAKKTGGEDAIYAAYRALALASVESGKFDEAGKYSDEALAHSDKTRLEELNPLFVKGLIAARSGDHTEAERILHEVENDRETNASLKFRAEHALAHLYEEQGRSATADREYQSALRTIEASRSTLKREDLKLPFSNNSRHVYDDYVQFLVANKKTGAALRWADYSRARTLNEGLGLVPKGGSTDPPRLDAQQIARRAGGALLFYWLGEKQSYLWAITPRKTSVFTLPPGKEIDGAVHRYREALKVQDVLASADKDGQSLYQTLIGPAHKLLENERKVFIIPDGSLNNLNFETLLVSEPKEPQTKLHYWIEDVTSADANSLRVLDRSLARKQKHDRTLLIVGNSVAPNDEYRELPQADAQMRSVESHFTKGEQKVLTREHATPSAYLASAPERFSYIHFVAHGTASRLSPLDSAIVLSRESTENNSFKLYARDIVRYPLRADLVTISSCYSAGDRSYSGEGLVGISWAFLRAGAHNVVAALWDVSDASTAQLMDKFYDELTKGASPDAALRTAKLSLLRGKEFHNPFYWAPFQLYAGLA
jgi:CHAT domain-containing protein